MTDPGTITSLVNRLSEGELLSRDDLFPIVYAELRGMVRERLRRDRMAKHIGATELVHVVFEKLFGASLNGHDAAGGTVGPALNGVDDCASCTGDQAASDSAPANDAARKRWQSRAHFFGAAGRAMEHILIDIARKQRRRSNRLGERAMGSVPGEALDPDALPGRTGEASLKLDVLMLSEALRDLEAQDAELADIVRQRVYLGRTVDQVARTLGVSSRTVQQNWSMARVWLLRRMKAGGRE